MILRNTLASTDPATYLRCDDDYDEYKDDAEFIEVTRACRELRLWVPGVRRRN